MSDALRKEQAHVARPSRLWLLVLAAFVGSVALLGGSSRPDAVQIIALRPLAGLSLVTALYFVARGDIAPVKPVVLGLLGLAGLMLFQIIPLPPAIWQSLPGRETVVDMGEALGMSDVWRPLSMVPSRTLNSLASLVVPIGGVLMLAVFAPDRRILMIILIGLGLLNALLGIVQISTGAGYLYEITNTGSSVGLFANRNHSAVFASLVLLAIGYVGTRQYWFGSNFRFQAGLTMAFLLVLTAALTSGSRAGLATTIFALAAVAAMRIANAGSSTASKSRKRVWDRLGRARIWLVALFFTALLLVAVVVALGRSDVVERILAANAWDDLRWDLVPYLFEMIRTYWLVGSGFGSFEEVYHIFEPSSLLLPSYLNMAHNDVAQFVIESGIPGVALLLVSVFWLGRNVVTIIRKHPSDHAASIFWCAILVVILGASLVDYPLRAPLFQLVGVILLVTLCRERSASTP